MDNNSDFLDKFRLTDVLYGYQDENIEFIKEESGVDGQTERFENQIVITVTHEVADNIAIAAY